MIGRLLRGGFMTAIYAYLYIPIIILIVNSFNRSRFGINWQGFTTDWYSLLMNNDSLLQARPALADHGGAVGDLRHPYRLADRRGAVPLPLSRQTVCQRHAVCGDDVARYCDGHLSAGAVYADRRPAGFWSLLFSHITFCLPFVVVTVYSRLKGFDVRMLEAAKDLGASEMTILRKIILPLALPAVAAGWLLSFTLSMDDVVVSSFVTGPGYEILPLKIYSMVKVGVSPEVNALATILLVLSLVMVIASQLIARDKTQGTLK